MDPAGVSQKYLSLMPRANIFDGGDGLNTGIHQWMRSAHGNANLGTASGTSYDADNRQFNVKVDHNFNPRYKVAVNYSYQWVDNEYILHIAGGDRRKNRTDSAAEPPTWESRHDRPANDVSARAMELRRRIEQKNSAHGIQEPAISRRRHQHSDHPVPNNPSLDINSTNPFGFIQDKGNQRREFKGMLRLDF
jgi:hypothetical protein